MVMVGKPRGFGSEPAQILPIGAASEVNTEPEQTLFDFRLLEQMPDACGAGAPELETQPLVGWVSQSELFGEAIKRVVHPTLR